MNYMGAYANMLNMFKSLSSTIKARINQARRTNNLISIDDIRNVLKTLEDMLNNNLCSLDTEVKIEVIDGISQTSPSVPPNNQENKRLNCNKNMNKKLIRLTESDLHRIVKESVNKVLNEVQLNELDPRTYASYADKRQAQGQGWKATKGRYAATDAWNNQYGKRDTSYNGKGGSANHQVYMKNDDYTVNDNYWDSYDGGNSNFTKYNPYDDSFHYDSNIRDGFGDLHSSQGVKQNYGGNNEGQYVAQQMAKGTGKYIKGKGWQ